MAWKPTNYTGDRIHISNERSDYTLRIDLASARANAPPWEWVYFLSNEEGVSSWVTGRDLKEYREKFPKLPLNGHLHYFEAGAGLGEFIHIVASLTTRKNRPIVCDIFPYDMAHDALTYASRHAYGALNNWGKQVFDRSGIGHRVDTLLERCETYLDSRKIRMIRTPIGSLHKEIGKTIAPVDVAIDLFGPLYLAGRSTGNGTLDLRTVDALENTIVKSPAGLFRVS